MNELKAMRSASRSTASDMVGHGDAWSALVLSAVGLPLAGAAIGGALALTARCHLPGCCPVGR